MQNERRRRLATAAQRLQLIAGLSSSIVRAQQDSLMRAPVGHGFMTRGLFSSCLLLFIFEVAIVFNLHPLGGEKNYFSFSVSWILISGGY